MTDTKHIDTEDLALHAMQLLSKDEATGVQTHLAECTECQAEYQEALSDLGIVAMTVELAEPAPESRERLLRQVSREKRVVSIASASQFNERAVVPIQTIATSSKLVPWLGWAVAAGVTFATVNAYRERGQMQNTIAGQSAQLQVETAQVNNLSADAAKARAIMDALTNSNAMRVTLNATPAAKALPQGRATYLADKGMLVFMANNLAPLPSGKTYELWLIPANGTAPIAAGTFHPDARGNASVVMPELPKGVAAKAFGVTMENDGGATTPTMPILLVGA
jgi:predicted anti-sigma-YlaC factor YlaD